MTLVVKIYVKSHGRLMPSCPLSSAWSHGQRLDGHIREISSCEPFPFVIFMKFGVLKHVGENGGGGPGGFQLPRTVVMRCLNANQLG